jgi:hypothetical protein
MPDALNPAQLEILKLFRNDQSEEELQELKSLLTTWLAAKVTFEADKAFHEKGYSTAIFEQWKQEHFRKTA